MYMRIFESIVADNSFAANVVLKRLPRNFKRMIYISSVVGLIFNRDDPDMVLIEKLNEIIHLARDVKTCQLPMHIRSAIWKNLDTSNVQVGQGKRITIGEILEKPLDSDRCSYIGEQIASSSPKWLTYGSKAIMANDIVVLIKHLQKLLLPPTQGNLLPA